MAASLSSPFALRAFASALAAVGLIGLTLPAHAEGRVAVVDMQHAVLQTEQGLKVQATLKKLFDKRQQEINAAQTELAQMEEDIKKQQWLLSKDAYLKRMEDWQQRMIAVQQKYIAYQKELQEKQANLAAPIIKKIASIVGRIANKKGFDVVIDRQAIAYVRADLDLTDQVIQMVNSGDSGDSGDAKDEAKPEEPRKVEPPKP